MIRDLFCAFHPKRSEAGDRPVVSGGVEPSEDPQALLRAGARGEIRLQGQVRNVFDQPESESRGRNPEDHVPILLLDGKVGLGQIASRRIHAAGDGVKTVDASIQRAVWILDEASLAHRAGGRNE